MYRLYRPEIGLRRPGSPLSCLSLTLLGGVGRWIHSAPLTPHGYNLREWRAKQSASSARPLDVAHSERLRGRVISGAPRRTRHSPSLVPSRGSNTLTWVFSLTEWGCRHHLTCAPAALMPPIRHDLRGLAYAGKPTKYGAEILMSHPTRLVGSEWMGHLWLCCLGL
ncbi:hypothetical protein GGI35DRAFT_258015 [Trichoderma velutinum]